MESGSRMRQTQGPDTQIEQFFPSRANPILRRAARKYYCQQTLANTDDFSTMSFNIEQSNPRMVINQMRLVLPIELQAQRWDRRAGAGEEPVETLRVDQNTFDATSNIAVGANAPWSAFSSMEMVINGKVYTKQFPRFSEMLGQCYQSFNELGFADNDSLKPISNSWKGHRDRIDYDGDEKGNSAYSIRNDDFQPLTFDLQEVNSGFSSRRRAFCEDIVNSGGTWRGKISAPFDCALFSAEQRKGGSNDMIPYVRSCYINCVWDTLMDNSEKQNPLNQTFYGAEQEDPRQLGLGRHVRTLPQKLFTFMTCFNAAFPGENRELPAATYAEWYTMRWWERPYVEIDWVEFSQPLLRDVYRLRYAQYQLEKTLPFRLEHTPKIDDRVWVTKQLQRDLLQVPNLIYIWAQPTKDSMSKNFIMGGVFRTLDLKNLRLRVNGHTDIIQDESPETMYRWFKRNTENVLQYDVWRKNKVYVISPGEIGLREFLENDAKLSVIDIQCDCAYSPLMNPEYERLAGHDYLEAVGYGALHDATTPLLQDLPEIQTSVTLTHDMKEKTQVYMLPRNGDYLEPTTTEVFFDIRGTDVAENSSYYNLTERSMYQTEAQPWNEHIGIESKYNLFLKEGEHEEQFTVNAIGSHNVYSSWVGGLTYWIMVNVNNERVGSTDGGEHIEIIVCPNTHQFCTTTTERAFSLPWAYLTNIHLSKDKNDPNKKHIPDAKILDGDKDVSEDHDAKLALQQFWGQVKNLAMVSAWPTYVSASADALDYQKAFTGAPPAFTLNEHASTKHYTGNNKIWTVGPRAHQFSLKPTAASDRSLTLHDSTDAQSHLQIDKNAAEEGWRFIKMADPIFTDDRFTGNVNPFKFKWADAEDPESNTYHVPTEHLMIKASLKRKVVGEFPRTKVDVKDPSQYGQQVTFRLKSETQKSAERDAAHTTSIEPEFELCTLFEYSKQSALIGSNRSKPQHNSNLIAS